MSDNYQIHVTTLGQMEALLNYYRAERGFALYGDSNYGTRLKDYPWTLINTHDKNIQGNRQRYEGVLTILFDQAFDLPIRKDKVEFALNKIDFTVRANGFTTISPPFGSVPFLPTEELIEYLLNARKELHPDKY